MNKKVIIRDANRKDALAIKNIQVQSIEQINSKDYTPRQIRAVTKHRTVKRYKYLMKTDEKFFVATRANKIVGFCSIKKNEIVKLYVHPKEISKGMGVKLLQYVERQTKSNRIKKLILKSTITAKYFYIKNGYKVIRKARHIRNGVSMLVIWMEKKL